MQNDIPNQHQDMPDPLDYKPGQKIIVSPQSGNSISSKSTFRIKWYVLPMVMNVIVFMLIQALVGASCRKVPEGLRGECGAGWINFLVVWPLEALVFAICFIILIIGLLRASKHA